MWRPKQFNQGLAKGGCALFCVVQTPANPESAHAYSNAIHTGLPVLSPIPVPFHPFVQPHISVKHRQ
jgi:hypothetical protein